MAEADADHLARRSAARMKLEQRLDPRQRLVDAGRRSGDQIGVDAPPVSGSSPPATSKLSISNSGPSSSREHRRIVAELHRPSRRGGRPVSRIATFMARRLATSMALRPMLNREREAMPNALEGRHALITGGGTGIGAAAADASQRRRREDYRCSAGGSSRSKRSPQSIGGTAIQCDVTDRDRDRRAPSTRRARPTARSTC